MRKESTLIKYNRTSTSKRMCSSKAAWQEVISKVYFFSIVLIVSFCLSTLSASAQNYIANREEFVGPFASWVDVKAKYGAKGDGVSDDTYALQRAFNELGASGENGPQVLYLPAGTYLITSGLTMSAKKYISIIGENPLSTKIKWAGASGGTMLFLNGVSFSLFSRITWDGSRTAASAIVHKWDASTGFAVTQIEHSDEAFVDVAHGIRAGTPLTHKMDAESSILRCRFIRNTTAGVSIESFNALDWFVWDSYFEDCRIGVTNNPPTGGAGNFHVYQSVFKRSTYADITIKNTSFFSIRDNYSIGSKAFFVGEPIGSNGAQMTIQRNIVLDTQDQTPIRISHKGPVTLLDNIIRSSFSTGPLVQSGADLITIGNTYSVSNAVSCSEKWITFDDVVQSRSLINPAEPALQATPVKTTRKIFELAPGTSVDDEFQTLINQAATLSGQRPVIHLRPGAYWLRNTVVIPAGTDLQIIGDGFHSRFSWYGPVGGDAIRLEGADQVVMREFSIIGNLNGRPGAGLVIKHSDQAGKHIFMQGANVWDSQEVGLLMEGFQHSNAELHDFYHKANPRVSVKVAGAGSSSAGGVNILGGCSHNNAAMNYDVVSGGRLMVQDMWYEGSTKSYINLAGSGTFTLNGVKIAPSVTATDVTVTLNNFSGKATFLGIQMNGKFVIQGDGANTQSLVMGTQFNKSSYSNSSAKAKAALLNSRLYNGSSVPLNNIGAVDGAFIKEMVKEVRNTRAVYKQQTGFILHRVQVGQTKVGIRILPGSGSSVAQPIESPAASCSAAGSISREYWANISGSSIGAIPLSSTPTSRSQLSSFESPVHVADNYGQRIRGYICAPASGNYTFYVAGDDNCELWLSTDANPTNKRKIASVSGWTNPKEWGKYSSQKSVSVSLQAGQRYYVEALHKESAGGDHVAVAWIVPGSSSIAVIPGARLSPFTISTAKLASDEEERQGSIYSFKVYPNPSSGEYLILEATDLEIEDELTISIYNSIGREVITQVWKADISGILQKELNFSNKLSSGIYTIVMQGKKRKMSQKLVITN